MRTQQARDEVTLTIVGGLVVAVLLGAAVLMLGLLVRGVGGPHLSDDGLVGAAVLVAVGVLVAWTRPGWSR